MANITLTNLPTVTGLNGTEPLLGVQSGTSVQITTGQIVSLATGGGGVLPLPVAAGGTGDKTLTANALLYGNGTAPVGVVTPPAGTNYVLVASAGSPPSWQPTIPVTAGVDSISFSTTGLTPSTDQAGVITVGGTLVAANGGTGLNTYAIGDIIYASGTTALSRLADVATGSALISGGVGVAPSWGKISLTTTVSGTLPIGNGGTGQATALTQYGIVYGASTTAMGVTASGTTGQILVATTGAAPSWSSTIPSTAGVVSIAFGTTGLTPSTATSGAVTVAGTLIAANGGTGQSTYAVGDLLYASTTTALSRLADVATGSVLISGGIGTAPSYSSSPTLSGTVTSAFYIANGAISGGLTNGAYAYGTLGFSDTNLFKSFASSVNTYNQEIIQNKNAGATASANIVVANNLATASTFFGEFGMNSSGYTGSGSFNLPSAVYLDSTSSDLSIGTTTANSVHFLVNNSATDSITINGTTALVSFPGTGAITLPVGTTAQEPTGSTGMIRFNTDKTAFEGYNGSLWSSIGGGATGGGTDQVFWNNGQTVNTSYSVPANTNAGTFGPITISASATVTVPASSTWTVV